MYIDNILVVSGGKAEHKLHLHQLFERLQEHGLIINVTYSHQCGQVLVWTLYTIDLPGHHITQNSAMPLPDKVKAIYNFKQPVTIKGQELEGMVNFYR